MIDLHFKYRQASEKILEGAPFKPLLSVILGSGLGSFADTIETVKALSNEDIPGYPSATVSGHSGQVYFSEYAGIPLVLFKGRIHLYEGNKLSECILPVFLSYKLGCRYMLLTNAAGGVNPDFIPGDLMLAESFNGIQLKKEITQVIGIAGVGQKQSFDDFPSAEFNSKITSAASEAGIELKKGTYWYTKGPSYETPAEIKMIKNFGGDAVGMSTVHEAVLGTWFRMKTSAISCITNYASGIGSEKLSHLDVTRTARLVEEKFGILVKGIIKQLRNQNSAL